MRAQPSVTNAASLLSSNVKGATSSASHFLVSTASSCFHPPSLARPATSNAVMVQHAASSHLHVVSCHDGSKDSSSELMKRPLIATAPQSGDASSLEAEEQQTRLKGKEGLVCQAFLLGSASGFLSEVILLPFATPSSRFEAKIPPFPVPS
jgi:hypothetical protein